MFQKLLLAITAAGLLAAGVVSVSAAEASAATPHVIGAFPNNIGNSTGGWLLYSNGRVTALQGAPYYGSATTRGLNNFVAMIGDSGGDGYWLITSTGKVFSFGATCQDQTLVIPANAPKINVVGAINPIGQMTEGFDMVTASGNTTPVTCQFSL